MNVYSLSLGILVKNSSYSQIEHTFHTKQIYLHTIITLDYLQLTKIQDLHKEELGRLSIELEDETNTRSNMDKRLADLRLEVSND